jgi:hypothetical protein
MIWYLAGCGQPLEEDAPFHPSAYEYEPQQTDPADLDLEVLAEELSLRIGELDRYSAASLLESYEQAIEAGDPYCPNSYENDGNSFWYASCSSSSGALFNGYMFYNQYEQADIFGDGGTWDATLLNGSADIVDPSGAKAHWGGTGYYAEGVSAEGADTFFTQINGSFKDDMAQEGSLLSEGFSPSFMQYALVRTLENQAGFSLDIRGYYASGTIALPGPNIFALFLDEVSIYDEAAGFPCAEEPHGRMEIRTAEGYWLDLEFDVDENWQLTGECDGCGMLSGPDGLLGEICIDTSPMLDWGDRPW